MADMRRIAIVVFEGLQALDALGPAEVFSQANRLGEPTYDVELVGRSAATTSGLEIGPLTAPADCLGALGGVDQLEERHGRQLLVGPAEDAVPRRVVHPEQAVGSRRAEEIGREGQQA